MITGTWSDSRLSICNSFPLPLVFCRNFLYLPHPIVRFTPSVGLPACGEVLDC